ncbi:hypothetical protein GCM10010946_20520 [Undibacterium squillarum]|uniref:Uncharacterized protein n=1 Tax=Undibacterium squillarum TaxID=1131567 RepID=A0ABQ2XYP7_9BURK|nr:hypothetical protein GCM10010946_20520 [Undibacterium squillarum]
MAGRKYRLNRKYAIARKYVSKSGDKMATSMNVMSRGGCRNSASKTCIPKKEYMPNLINKEAAKPKQPIISE